MTYQDLPALVAARPGENPLSVLRNEPLLQILNNYVQYYASGAGHTARAKRYDLQHFLSYIAEQVGCEADEVLVEDWTYQHTYNFVEDRIARGEAPATVARRLATLKHFGRTLAERVPGFVNPAREVRPPQATKERPQGLSNEEIDALRNCAREKALATDAKFNDVRNYFLVELLLETGLRADEARLLVYSQWSDDRAWLKNVKTKGKKYRNVYVSEHLRKIAQHYSEVREQALAAQHEGYLRLSANEKALFPVFISFYRAELSNPSSFGISSKTLWRIISDLGVSASEHATSALLKLHPHRLRHTFAHGLLDSSRDVRLVAQALGHSDVRTTMRYTERTELEVAEAIEARKKPRTPESERVD